MNTNLLEIINSIVSNHGEDILGDPIRLKSFFSDFAKDEPKEERVAFGRCIEMGCYSELRKCRTENERIQTKTNLIQKLHTSTGINLNLCKDSLDLLDAALFGNVVKTSLSSNQHISRNTSLNIVNKKSKLLVIALVLAPIITVIDILLQYSWFLPLYEIIFIAISTILTILGRKNNNRKFIITAGIFYLLYITGIPSAILCFIEFGKMKNQFSSNTLVQPPNIQAYTPKRTNWALIILILLLVILGVIFIPNIVNNQIGDNVIPSISLSIDYDKAGRDLMALVNFNGSLTMSEYKNVLKETGMSSKDFFTLLKNDPYEMASMDEFLQLLSLDMASDTIKEFNIDVSNLKRALGE